MIVLRTIGIQTIALILALNYFTFQIEPFDEEYAEHHPQASPVQAFSAPQLSWESFDKENAHEAYALSAPGYFQVIVFLPCVPGVQEPATILIDDVRDKSPPASPSPI